MHRFRPRKIRTILMLGGGQNDKVELTFSFTGIFDQSDVSDAGVIQEYWTEQYVYARDTLNGNQTIAPSDIKWSSSDSEILEVEVLEPDSEYSSRLALRGKRAGEVNLIASYGEQQFEIPLTVLEFQPNLEWIEPITDTVSVGHQIKIADNLRLVGGGEISFPIIRYGIIRTDAPDVIMAPEYQNEVLFPIKPGKATIGVCYFRDGQYYYAEPQTVTVEMDERWGWYIDGKEVHVVNGTGMWFAFNPSTFDNSYPYPDEEEPIKLYNDIREQIGVEGVVLDNDIQSKENGENYIADLQTNSYGFQYKYFDGQGHTLYDYMPATNIALFNEIPEGFTVRNLNIDGVNFRMIAGGSEYGTGLIAEENRGTIENCNVTLNGFALDSYGTLAGFVGNNYGTIKDCRFAGNVTVKNSSDGLDYNSFYPIAANELPDAGGKLINCEVYDTVITTDSVGSLMTMQADYAESCVIRDSSIERTVDSLIANNQIAGLCIYLAEELRDCHMTNCKIISESGAASGLVAIADSGDSIIIACSVTDCEIVGENLSAGAIIGDVDGANGDHKILGCLSANNVISVNAIYNEHVGGIAGSTENVIASISSNDDLANSSSRFDIGYIAGSAVTADDVYYYTTDTGFRRLGGIGSLTNEGGVYEVDSTDEWPQVVDKINQNDELQEAGYHFEYDEGLGYPVLKEGSVPDSGEEGGETDPDEPGTDPDNPGGDVSTPEELREIYDLLSLAVADAKYSGDVSSAQEGNDFVTTYILNGVEYKDSHNFVFCGSVEETMNSSTFAMTSEVNLTDGTTIDGVPHTASWRADSTTGEVYNLIVDGQKVEL